jgi:predicted membrane channel-forming protein YqfA (hemolysin III family)
VFFPENLLISETFICCAAEKCVNLNHIIESKNQFSVKEFLSYLGIFIMLAGVALLAYYHFGNRSANVILGTAGILVIIGFLVQLFLFKRNRQ